MIIFALTVSSIAAASVIAAVPFRFRYAGHQRCKQETAMISTSEDYATATEERDGIPPPSPQDQELIVDAWREVLAEVLYARDTEWKEQLRAIRAESMAAVAQLRAAAAEFRNNLEGMIAERLAQVRQPMDGKEGQQGERGQKGDKGEPGRLPIVRAWMEDEISYAGDVVSCDGGTWQARKDTSKRPPYPDWNPLALPGRAAVSPKVRGTYRDDTTYQHLDIVALNGSSFIARCENPGECPGDNWQLVASCGRAGKSGPAGPRGERGERGPSATSVINSWQIDHEQYRATPLMSDGSEGPALELRPLFEQYHAETR
jgi:hypothetical protein